MLGVRGANRLRGWGGLLAAVLMLAAACSGETQTTASGGGDEEASFEGETITFVVSFAPGGGYDTIARAFAPYLEEELGATVVVENEDGAGGLLAASQIYAAEPDGLTIGIFAGQGIAGAAMAEAEGVQFELAEYSYVTRLAAELRVLVATPNSEYQAIEDVRDGQGVNFASAGTGAADNMDATVLYPVLGIDGRIVTGFDGSEETALAVTSGDVAVGSGTVSSRLAAIKSGDLHPVLVIGDQESPDLPDVPVLTDLELDDESRALAEAHLSLQDMGRMVWAPPGVPEDRLQALEDAFKAASENPDLIQELAQAEQEIEFTPGAEAKTVAEDVLDAPDEYVTLIKEAFEGQ
ncbi:MAG: hypothetical protein GEU93_09035 [Propionibacteriales bacterium]|nr:hypothetical protein [Propionibacteriales bacterium]